jgi:hypothetical protein
MRRTDGLWRLFDNLYEIFHSFCDRCLKKCVQCMDWNCPECAIHCSAGGEECCQNCLDECVTCHSRFCVKHASFCRICTSLACEICCSACSSCEVAMCSFCSNRSAHCAVCRSLLCRSCKSKSKTCHSCYRHESLSSVNAQCKSWRSRKVINNLT